MLHVGRESTIGLTQVFFFFFTLYTFGYINSVSNQKPTVGSGLL